MTSVPTILLAEERDEAFAWLTQALQNTKTRCALRRERTAGEVMKYLAADRLFADHPAHPVPCLLLLDIDADQAQLVDCVKWIHRQPRLKRIPRVVLDSSGNQRAIDTAYGLGVSSVIHRPLDNTGYSITASLLVDYWLNWNIQS